jgi:hypothetical protein
MPYFRLLDFLGFPWILSSESRLINRLHAAFGGRNFRGPLARAAGGAEAGGSVSGLRTRGIVHGTSLAVFLFFGKQLSTLAAVVRAAPSETALTAGK